jgi:lysyl-tRNA synthetase class 2
MLEFYQAYANYHDLMKLSEELIIFVAKQVNGTCITHFNGHEIDLGKWHRYSMREAIIKFWPIDFQVPLELSDLTDRGKLLLKLQLALDGGEDRTQSIAQPEGITQNNDFESVAKKLKTAFHDFRKEESLGKVIATVFEAVVEPYLIQPTIIYDFPLVISPLSKKKPDEPDWVERFEFYIGGFEVGNAFSELNDPVDQLERFQQQMVQKDKGDDEAHQMDEDYVRALGYGLPPTAGEGIGIDRLTMVLTDSKSIRDVILFPLLRPQTKQIETGEGKHGESAE